MSTPQPLTPRPSGEGRPSALGNLGQILRVRVFSLALLWLLVLGMSYFTEEAGVHLLVSAALILSAYIVLAPSIEEGREYRDIPLPPRDWRIDHSRRLKVRTLRLVYVGHPDGQRQFAVRRGLRFRPLWDELARTAWDEDTEERIRLARTVEFTQAAADAAEAGAAA